MTTAVHSIRNPVLVLPTFNEVENLDSFVRAVRATSPTLHILIVDDHSPDGTGAVADRLATELGKIDVIHRIGERGLGSAYRAGFAQALSQNFDAIITMDADFSHDPVVIPTMLIELQRGSDIVIGSRYIAGGAIVGWPLHRRMLSRWGNSYTRFILCLTPRDCTSGYRAYSSAALALIKPSGEHGEGYVSLTTFIRRAQQFDLIIKEVQIIFTNRVRGSSKMSLRIIAESMILVTLLGIKDAAARLSRSIRRTT